MIFKFNKAIIDATAPYCVAYKPNLAFYESRGIDGMIAFENTIRLKPKEGADVHADGDILAIVTIVTKRQYGRTTTKDNSTKAMAMAMITHDADWKMNAAT